MTRPHLTRFIAVVLAASSLLACEGAPPSMVEPDAGAGLEIFVDPSAAFYPVGTTVQLRTEGLADWTVEAAEEPPAVVTGARSILVRLNREGWTVATACDDRACGHVSLLASLDDLRLEVQTGESVSFRGFTESDIPLFLSSWQPEPSLYTEFEGVPGEWVFVPEPGRVPQRYELSAFTRSQRVTQIVEAWSTRISDDPRSRVYLAGMVDEPCDPLMAMFREILLHESFEPVLSSDLVVEVTAVEAVDTAMCNNLRFRGSTSGQWEGVDATGTFEVSINWQPRALPTAFSVGIVTVTGDLSTTPVTEAIRTLVRRRWTRFVRAPYEALTRTFTSPHGVSVTPSFIDCPTCIDLSLHLPGAHHEPAGGDYCGSVSTLGPFTVGDILYNAMLIAWWEEFPDTHPWPAIGLGGLDIPPMIVNREHAGSWATRVLLVAGAEVTVGGETYLGRIEHPLSDSLEGLGFVLSGEPSVWLLDGRRLTSASSADRAIYDAFVAAFAALYDEIRVFVELPRPDPIARWITEFPSAGLDQFALETAPCEETDYPCGRICGRWIRVP